RRTLQELAQAQKLHFEQRKVYAGRLEDLAAWFTAPGEVRVSLIHADNKNWRAVARHRESRKAFVYDAAAGGLLSEPILVAP
ncbi:MAG: hypothetical protein AB1896_12485, partial [Thermodesulfobacteriota bacterium]